MVSSEEQKGALRKLAKSVKLNNLRPNAANGR
jgi:hypothetical protein